MPYIGKEPADIIATAVDTTTGTFSGAVSAASVDADGGVTVDNITIDGTEIDLSSGNLTLDVAGQLIVNSDSGQVVLQDDAVNWGNLQNSSGDFIIGSLGADKDIIFQGLDGSSTIEAMRIDVSEGGKVGIGTTSPDGTLHVHSASAGSVTANSAGDELVVENSGDGGINILTPDANRSALFFGHASDNNKMQIRHDGNTSLSQIISDDELTFNVGDGSERMRIDSSGKVGIGESSPDTPLHITYAKDVAYSVDNFTQEANVALKIENTSSTANAFSSMQFRVGSGADLFFGIEQKSANDGDFVFGNQNSTDVEMARITNRPCLVVGVSGDTDARIYGSRSDTGTAVVFSESTSTSTSGIRSIVSSLNQNSNNSNCQHLRATTQNIATFRLDGNGTSTFSSDERLKKNIETTRDGYLEDLAKLRVVKYNWHDADVSTDKELGLIAQEVQKVFPKLVVEDDESLNGIEKPLALKVSVLPVMLLKALQEANTKITALESRIKALESA